MVQYVFIKSSGTKLEYGIRICYVYACKYSHYEYTYARKNDFFLKKIPGMYRQVATDAIGTIQREMKEKGINPERQTPSGCRVQGL